MKTIDDLKAIARLVAPVGTTINSSISGPDGPRVWFRSDEALCYYLIGDGRLGVYSKYGTVAFIGHRELRTAMILLDAMEPEFQGTLQETSDE